MRAAGLALRVAPSGLKTWGLAYRIARATKVRRLSLGRFGDLGLNAARARAHELTSAARQGVDLIAQELEARDAKAQAMTVDKLIELISRAVSEDDCVLQWRWSVSSDPCLSRCRPPAADVRKRDLLPLF